MCGYFPHKEKDTKNRRITEIRTAKPEATYFEGKKVFSNTAVATSN